MWLCSCIHLTTWHRQQASRSEDVPGLCGRILVVQGRGLASQGQQTSLAEQLLSVRLSCAVWSVAACIVSAQPSACPQFAQGRARLTRPVNLVEWRDPSLQSGDRGRQTWLPDGLPPGICICISPSSRNRQLERSASTCSHGPCGRRGHTLCNSRETLSIRRSCIQKCPG